MNDDNKFFPPNWPRCPSCGDNSKPGILTCGDSGCVAAHRRRTDPTGELERVRTEIMERHYAIAVQCAGFGVGVAYVRIVGKVSA